jgi:hypothetical protein
MNLKYFSIVLFLLIGLYVYFSSSTSKVQNVVKAEINKSLSVENSITAKENSDEFLIVKKISNLSKIEINETSSSLTPILKENSLERKELLNNDKPTFLEVTPSYHKVGRDNEEGEGIAVSIVPLKNIGVNNKLIEK